jgi:hypothetical protein
LDLLILPPFVRVDDLPELADSIAREGLKRPLVARATSEGMLLVAGTRRYSAIKYLIGRKTPVYHPRTGGLGPPGVVYRVVPVEVVEA